MKRIKGQLFFEYEKEADVLYSYIDHPRVADIKDLNNGIYLRIDRKSKKVVGFTIVDCLDRIARGLIKEVPCFDDIGPIENYCK
jgi:uncharacterized protein YuzE